MLCRYLQMYVLRMCVCVLLLLCFFICVCLHISSSKIGQADGATNSTGLFIHQPFRNTTCRFRISAVSTWNDVCTLWYKRFSHHYFYVALGSFFLYYFNEIDCVRANFTCKLYEHFNLNVWKTIDRSIVWNYMCCARHFFRFSPFVLRRISLHSSLVSAWFLFSRLNRNWNFSAQLNGHGLS